MKFWESLIFFLKIIKFYLDISFGFINTICRLFSCCTFFNFLWKQGKVVVYVLIRAFLIFKNLKNNVKQCVSYSSFTTFLNTWKILVCNYRIWMFFSLFTYFSAILLKATEKIDQSACYKYMGNLMRIFREKNAV